MLELAALLENLHRGSGYCEKQQEVFELHITVPKFSFTRMKADSGDGENTSSLFPIRKGLQFILFLLIMSLAY